MNPITEQLLADIERVDKEKIKESLREIKMKDFLYCWYAVCAFVITIWVFLFLRIMDDHATKKNAADERVAAATERIADITSLLFGWKYPPKYEFICRHDHTLITRRLENGDFVAICGPK